MKSEVVYIWGLFFGKSPTNLFKLSIEFQTVSEVLLFECSSPDEVAVVIPYFDSEIILEKGNLKSYLYDAETRLINFILKEPIKVPDCDCEAHGTVSIKLLPEESDSISNNYKSEFCIFRDFSNKHFHGVESEQMEIDTHKRLELLDWLQSTLYDLSLKHTSLYDRRFKVLLRAYVYFLNHKQLDEKKFKKFMRSQENLPYFLKNVLGFSDYDAFFFNISEVLRSHICPCNKATHKKCSACRFLPSCSMECQKNNWADHKGVCRLEKSGRNSFEKERQRLLGHLMNKFSSTSVPVSFEVFQQELMDAILTTCCIIIEESDVLDEWIQKYFDDVPKIKWAEEMLSLKKKPYEKMYRNLDLSEVMLQLDSAWGKADSRGNSEELIDIFFYLIRATSILILSPLIAAYYFCEEMFQLVSAWGKADSRGNFEELVDTFFYLIRTTLLLILSPSIIACYFCEEMVSLILYFIRSS